MTSAFAPTWTVTKPAVVGRGGIVTAQNAKAASVGAEVLAAGGNAVDAAIATSFALGAVEPWMSGMGGGGCMLVAPGDGGPVRAIDFAMVAPTRLDPEAYALTGTPAADLFGWPGVVEDRNVHGPLAVCVPGQVAGMGLAHGLFATMPWAELVEPAVELAENGLEIDWFAALVIANGQRDLARYPASRETWLPGGFSPALEYAGAATPLSLGRLAETLSLVAEEGPDGFYRGEAGGALVRDLQAMGGVLALDDLASYEAREVAPLEIAYRDARLFAMRGLFAGPTFARCLELLAPRPMGGAPGEAAFVAYAEALRQAYTERLATMGAGDQAPSCTSHFCVVDRQGTIVTVTQTLLSLFGSRVVSPSTGILLNNGIMWFDPRPGRPNSIRAGVRPLTNMCPVVGQTEGFRYGMGASGGRRILPSVLQLSSFLVDHGLSLEQAFHTPRIDVSGGEEVVMNPALDDKTQGALRFRFKVRAGRPSVYPTLYACPSAVLRTAEGVNMGAAEPILPWAGPVAEPVP